MHAVCGCTHALRPPGLRHARASPADMLAAAGASCWRRSAHTSSARSRASGASSPSSRPSSRGLRQARDARPVPEQMPHVSTRQYLTCSTATDIDGTKVGCGAGRRQREVRGRGLHAEDAEWCAAGALVPMNLFTGWLPAMPSVSVPVPLVMGYRRAAAPAWRPACVHADLQKLVCQGQG